MSLEFTLSNFRIAQSSKLQVERTVAKATNNHSNAIKCQKTDDLPGYRFALARTNPVASA
jgi:hypothetical protein